MIATTIPSVAIGGFFYCARSLHATLDTLIIQNLDEHLTNSTDLEITSLLFPMWFYYMVQWNMLISRIQVKTIAWSSELFHLVFFPQLTRLISGTLPPIPEFISLMVLIDRLPELTPKLFDNLDPFNPKIWPPGYLEDREKVILSFHAWKATLSQEVPLQKVLLDGFNTQKASIDQDPGNPKLMQRDLWGPNDPRLGNEPFFCTTQEEEAWQAKFSDNGREVKTPKGHGRERKPKKKQRIQ